MYIVKIYRKALKIVKKGEEWDEQNEKNEVHLFKLIKHDNLIKYFEHFDELIFGSDYFCLVCELCEVKIRPFSF